MTIEELDKAAAREVRSEARFQQHMRECREKNMREDLKIRALDWMQRENPAVVREWEAELSAKK